MKKWEYRHYNGKLSESGLNDYGEKGWELVSHSAVTDGYNIQQYYIFKREKEESK